MIYVGAVVEAVRNGGRDDQGLPLAAPVKGRRYVVTGVYKMKYGIGCTLAGCDPAPYRGFFVVVRKRNPYGFAPGEYLKVVPRKQLLLEEAERILS